MAYGTLFLALTKELVFPKCSCSTFREGNLRDCTLCTAEWVVVRTEGCLRASRDNSPRRPFFLKASYMAVIY